MVTKAVQNTHSPSKTMRTSQMVGTAASNATGKEGDSSNNRRVRVHMPRNRLFIGKTPFRHLWFCWGWVSSRRPSRIQSMRIRGTCDQRLSLALVGGYLLWARSTKRG